MSRRPWPPQHGADRFGRLGTRPSEKRFNLPLEETDKQHDRNQQANPEQGGGQSDQDRQREAEHKQGGQQGGYSERDKQR
jgi:hypothetical protein